MIKRTISWTLAILMVLGILSSCDKDGEEVDTEPTQTEIINQWIWDVMNDVYFWSADVPQDLEPLEETDSEAFFYKLLHPDDRFSWIVDDYEELQKSFNNIETGNGISPYFIRFSGSDEVFMIVEYTVEGSPAADSGIQRGDIIIEINDQVLTINNYLELFYAENTTLAFADYDAGENTLVRNNREITLQAEVIDENPVHHYEIIEYENTNIGYLVYTQFTGGEGDKYLTALDNAFTEFESQGIDEIVIDLRYNPGGAVRMATHIASILCPASATSNEEVFVRYQWNNAYQDYFTNNPDYGPDSEYLVQLLEANPPVQTELPDVYFLTSSRSASASELLIIGMEPYANVIQVGENTYGKFYGSITIPDTEDPPRHEWAMQPIVFKYASSTGYSGFTDGLSPDYQVDDNLLTAKPFGDITDPLLSKTLEVITGVSPTGTKSLDRGPAYEILPDPVREEKNRVTVPFPEELRMPRL